MLGLPGSGSILPGAEEKRFCRLTSLLWHFIHFVLQVLAEETLQHEDV